MRAVLMVVALGVITGCAPSGIAVSPSAAHGQAIAPVPGEASTMTSSPGPSAPSEVPSVPVIRATLPPAREAVAPVHLDYPGIAAQVPVRPTGVGPDGQMEIPEDAADAGWYQFGATPDSGQGATVIAAHAGSVQTPEGPLYRLRDARPGEELTVRDASGQTHRYSVRTVERHGKEGLDFTPYFVRDGPAHLVMITCGGQWIPELSSYADNIIVVADPVS